MVHSPFYSALLSGIQDKETFLCIGLDPVCDLIPSGFPQTLSGIKQYLSLVIDVTQDLCIAYKPNISFFEALGIEGLRLLEDLRKSYPDLLWIIDAKRGDIGNTSAMQAKFLYDILGASAVTLHPYMGFDSLAPFFNYKNGFNFVLGLTSNPGSADFEMQTLASGHLLCESVLDYCSQWNAKTHNVGVVVGATQTSHLAQLRQRHPELLYLVPGVGAQGGDLASVQTKGVNSDGAVIINASRAILYGHPTDIELSKSIRGRAVAFRHGA